MTPEVATVVIILSIVGGIGLGVAVCFIVPKFREYFANKQRDKILHEAQVKADKIIKNAQIDGKQTVAELKSEAEKEIKERRSEIAQTENRLLQREQNIDRRDAILQTKEETLEQKNQTLTRQIQENQKKEKTLQEKLDGIIDELQKVSQMSIQEAKEEIFQRVESKMSKEIAVYIKNKEDEANEICDARARELSRTR